MTKRISSQAESTGAQNRQRNEVPCNCESNEVAHLAASQLTTSAWERRWMEKLTSLHSWRMHRLFLLLGRRLLSTHDHVNRINNGALAHTHTKRHPYSSPIYSKGSPRPSLDTDARCLSPFQPDTRRKPTALGVQTERSLSQIKPLLLLIAESLLFDRNLASSHAQRQPQHRCSPSQHLRHPAL